MKKPRKSGSAEGELIVSGAAVSAPALQASFVEVVDLIQKARQRAFHAVNTELIDLYWQIGEYISSKLETAAWGKGVVNQLVDYVARQHPDIKVTPRNLLRMRKFYETYRDDEQAASLVRQLSWSHNLLILSRCKRPEEREFYLRKTLQERWGKRQLDAQLSWVLSERMALAPPIVSPPATPVHPLAPTVLKDAYLIDFLYLPEVRSEQDLQRRLVANLREFLLELGADFTFVGEQFWVQVGGRDFFLDLLFFHRGLNALVAFELKVEEFQPEHLGELAFSLEALDRDVRKPHERPPIGVLLCATKNQEAVEYALTRLLSPALVAEYQTRLPDKKLLQAKLHEFYELAIEAAADTWAPTPAKSKAKRGTR
jgi:predicted nuclease of restriction endonuclease-like (RecB) superfamily